MTPATLPEFRNEPYADFSQPAVRQAAEGALRQVRSEFGREYLLRIGGDWIATGDPLVSVNPSNPREAVGIHHRATPELASRAVEAADAYFPKWSRTPAAERVRLLLEAARILRARKMEFDAWLVLEAGKTWPEAEADVSEGIDFCEYYAREMLRLAGPQRVHQLPGEHDEMIYIPLGVGVVIPPWNFPAAILIGMTVASLVAGNTAIVKPSSETPTIAAKFAEVLLEAGFPEASFTLLTGSGSTVGDVLVEHPKTRFISFTGSRDVGLRINELAARHRPGQIWIKRVIAEMGGKDAIIVDADADLDKAVDGVLASAFGYQGQKCSACSRAIVDAQVYDAFLEKLAAKTKNIKVGPSEDFGNYMGPVINETARQTILEYIEIGKREGRLVAGGEAGAPCPGGPAISSRPPSLRMSSRAPESFRKRSSARSWPSPKRAISSTRSAWPTTRNTVSLARFSRTTPTTCARPKSASTSATCISTGSAPARWWAPTPSAASTCPARIPRPAGPIIYCCSCKRNR